MVAAILNAVNEANGSPVIVAGEVSDDAYAALSEQFASDNGTTVLRFDTDAARIQSAVKYRAKQLKRNLAFAPIELHNGEDWTIAGYAVRAR
jgi:hypothetical protein